MCRCFVGELVSRVQRDQLEVAMLFAQKDQKKNKEGSTETGKDELLGQSSDQPLNDQKPYPYPYDTEDNPEDLPSNELQGE